MLDYYLSFTLKEKWPALGELLELHQVLGASPDSAALYKAGILEEEITGQ